MANPREDRATSQRSSRMPQRLIIAGILNVMGGWITRNYAESRLHEAIRIAPIRDLVGGPTIESAVSLGYIGLGVLIFGAALVLAGLTVMAIRKVDWMSEQP
jgi:hypothetical protein